MRKVGEELVLVAKSLMPMVTGNLELVAKSYNHRRESLPSTTSA